MKDCGIHIIPFLTPFCPQPPFHETKDNFDGTKVQYIDKLDELKTLGNPVQRHGEQRMVGLEWFCWELGQLVVILGK